MLKCVCYLAVIGVASFFLGRLMPKQWFRYDCFPYLPFAFEREGQLYVRLGVRKWKEGFPDMSAVAPKLIPSKRLPKSLTAAHAELMIVETCVAEWVHKLLVIAGFGCVLIWKGTGGWIISLLNGLGNLPYIIIQRYNRPKLVRLYHRLKAKELVHVKERQESIYEQGIDFELQYGGGT